MKVLCIDYERYEFPQKTTDIDSFVEFINRNDQQFVTMRQFNEDSCVFPYLVDEDVRTVYVNFSNVSTIFEEEATVLKRTEYDARLSVCVNTICLECENYEDGCSSNNLAGCKENMRLDGICDSYCRIDDED